MGINALGNAVLSTVEWRSAVSNVCTRSTEAWSQGTRTADVIIRAVASVMLANDHAFSVHATVIVGLARIHRARARCVKLAPFSTACAIVVVADNVAVTVDTVEDTLEPVAMRHC